ncbi:MAG: LamG domain-containing protein, partial [Pirellulaceae bacterium]|nr:LamG domain-containing protein [Pirellulaceae bacterium]
LWLDASQLPPTSDPIARWANSAGGDFETQQKQASRRPEILAEALQGKAVARFRGAQCLEISKTSDAMNLGSDFTFAYVARGVAGTLLSKGAGGKAGQFSLLSDSCFLTNGEVNPQSNGRLAAAADDPTQFRARTIAADASGLTWFVDGTASGSYTDDRHEIQNERTLRIGSAWFRSGQEDAAGFFVGDLAELLIYSRALPEDERQRVEAYLREKWLAGDTPPAPLDLVAPTPASPPAEDVAPDNLAATAAAETAPESAAAPAAEWRKQLRNPPRRRRPNSRWPRRARFGAKSGATFAASTWKPSINYGTHSPNLTCRKPRIGSKGRRTSTTTTANAFAAFCSRR